MRSPSHLIGILTNMVIVSESFDNIYLDLSRESGKCRFAENGLGWKPAGGGDAFTLDQSNIGGANWSRAAKGYQLKILQRNSGLIQLDGFQQEVSGILTGVYQRNQQAKRASADGLVCDRRTTSA